MKKRILNHWVFWKENWLGQLVREIPLHGKWKGYKKLLVSSIATPGVDKIPTQEEYESALMGDEDFDKRIVKLG